MPLLAAIPAPFPAPPLVVPAEWIDRNGHMNVVYYLVASERATNAFYPLLGIDEAYRAESGCGMFAVEQHTHYRAELRLGDPVRVTCTLLDFDAKRIHFVNRVYHGGEDRLSAAVETIELHIDLARRRAAAFPPAIMARLAAIRAAHGTLPPPAEASRAMSLRNRRDKATAVPPPATPPDTDTTG